MGSEKRERQKAQRAARVEAAREAERRAARKRRLITAGVIGGAFVVVLGLIALFGGDDDEAEVATEENAEENTEITDVSGEPCVGLTDELPEGAPEFDAPEGDPPTELIVQDLVEGDGQEMAEGDEVVVEYLGVACSTGEIFDNSYERGEPAQFSLDQVIPGWTEGLPGLAEGGTRLLTIPPDMAYGDAGSGPQISPGESLVFVVELVEVVGD